MKNLRQQQGFTLIELMIVIAIIGILAAVAIPQYQTFTLRADSTAIVTPAIRQAQLAVGEYISSQGQLPADCATLAGAVPFDCASDGQLGKALTVELLANGEIEVTMDSAANGVSPDLADETVRVVPQLNNGNTTWVIDRAQSSLDDDYLPRLPAIN